MSTEGCWCGAPTTLAGDVYSPQLRCRRADSHVPDSDGRPERVGRLYIAGPMSGYPDLNIEAFDYAEESLAYAGWEVVNPATVKFDAAHYVDYLRHDLTLLIECDGVATIERWWESTGARNEIQVAGLLRMPVRSWADWALMPPGRPA